MADGIELAKLDAAERQLRQAIRLFFSRGDEVSTHTLTCAASQVLRDLATQKGLPSPIRNAVLEYVREERQKEFLGLLDKARNFFKHADRDANETLTFYPDLTKWLIFEAIQVHLTVASCYLPETFVFLTWVDLRHPDILLEGPLKAFFTSDLAKDIDTDDYGVLLMVIDWWRKIHGERFTLPVSGSAS